MTKVVEVTKVGATGDIWKAPFNHDFTPVKHGMSSIYSAIYSILVALADSSWSPLPVSEVVVCVAVVRHQSLADVHQKGR